MALQTQDLDVRRDIGLLKAGKASHRYDVVGFGVPIGHTNPALSATVHCQSPELVTRYLQPGIAEEQNE